MSQIKGKFKSRGFVNGNGVVGFEYWEALIARNDDPDRNWIFWHNPFQPNQRECFVVGENFVAH